MIGCLQRQRRKKRMAKPRVPKEDLELIDESLTFSAHLLMEKHKMTVSEAKRLIRERLNTEI